MSLQAVLLRVAIFTLLASCNAFQFITKNTLPSNDLSANCIASLTKDIPNCPRQISTFAKGSYFEADALEEACTADCAASISAYSSAANNACGPTDVYNITDTRTAPISFVPELLYYYFNRTCLQDGNRWCNRVAYEMSNGTTPSLRMFSVNETASLNGSAEAIPSPIIRRQQQMEIDMCDNCVIKAYQFQAGSPINGGYALQANYSTLTASCSKTGFPLATSTAPFEGPTPTPAAPQKCTGKTYTIKSGDTCRSISKAENIATSWLLADNGLKAYCAEFPTTGDLCIQNTCSTYTVQQGDVCLDIAKANRISQVQLYTWNPVLGYLCNRIEKSVGDTICVTPPGDQDFEPNPTTTLVPTPIPTATPTAVPVPGDLANGTNTHCAKFYQVQPEEYCNLLVIKFSISLDDFRFLNQGINVNCTNLFAFESYCVEPVGPVNEYPGHPDYMPPATSVAEIPYNSLPKATFTAPPILGLPTPSPLAKGTRKDCFLFMNGANLTVDETLLQTYPSSCAALAKGWGISLEQLENWNPSLMTNSTDCAPSKELRYCMAAYNGGSPVDVTLPEEGEDFYPIRAGVIEGCVEYEAVVPPMTCQSFLDRNQITIAQFYKMNPAVGPDCTGLWLKYRYCISTDALPSDVISSTFTPTPTPTSAPPTSTAPAIPGPTHPGTVAGCNKWHVVGSGDSCWTISQLYGIGLDTFYKWNPAIQNDCATNFWPDYAYCVGISG
ncbi:carbohydrate-binding module family 50 protein [Bipolaris sorokiniana ND90Pr]|uniref:Carbohydrate-binding module family 50 protein n=1 Tax=Cochliobolus sativus (strain ND90Pr / ATCC 201652) TaxID=665912 RepID=M2RPR2_COCSN|nr:carbohydrate-binding module family 50 protein [Bipolaris sorokiniana ND90Pr]EMD68574.1 carbohydrate-binding module family 50 protein [Bipolaris sorokiniana ND90Pr]